MGARNIQRLVQEFLLKADTFDLASTDVLTVLPVTDDSGAINIGDGTNDMDVKIFLGSSTEYVDFNVGDSTLDITVPITTNSTITSSSNVILNAGTLTETGTARTKHKVNAITSNTTLNTTHLGGIVTTRGAGGAVTVTLPAASGNSGEWVRIANVADQNLIVTGTDEELVVFNDATADSIAFQTTGEKIGGAFECVCDGTSWLIQPLATETQTVTIVSA